MADKRNYYSISGNEWTRVVDGLASATIARKIKGVSYYSLAFDSSFDIPSGTIAENETALEIFTENDSEKIDDNSISFIWIRCDEGQSGGVVVSSDSSQLKNELYLYLQRHEIFSVSRRFNLPKTQSIDVVIDPTNHVGKFRVEPISLIGTSGGPIFVDAYENPVFTSGDIQYGVDRNLVNPVLSHGVVIVNPVVSNPGSILPPEFMVPSNGTSAVTKAGGQTGEDLELSLDTNKKYMFRFTNQDNVTDAIVQFSITWIETR